MREYAARHPYVPVLTKTYQKRQREYKEIRRRHTYREYLGQLEQVVEAEMQCQQAIMQNNDVNTKECINRILSVPPRIWKRTPKHTDFLSLRLGCGDLPFNADIQYSERKFTVEQDILAEMMYQFGEKERFLKDVPISVPLKERFISGIYGDKDVLYTYAQSLILQLVTTHSYDEMKLVLLYDESQAEYFSFARWLTHSMDDLRKVRYVATNSEEAKILSSTLDSILEYRKNLSDTKLEDEKPYFVIICTDKSLALKAECVRRVLENKKYVGFSVISVFERLVDLPKECTAVTEITRSGGKLTLIGDVSEQPVPFTVDLQREIDLPSVTSVLANTFVDTSGSDFTLPKKYTFFEMMDIGMIEHLNLGKNWALNNPTKSLAATIGIDKYGEPFKLDLHERAHGPHGLVAGMTGSGKSEFIISFILSMAVSYHPYEVAFILIDYKGGGMAKAFENIPHTAGVITNLDGNGIKRSLSSMKSELHRREKIFSEASKKHNFSNIDIYKYQKLFREGKVTLPLPHLFIISDEFAELKKEQPDFMTELTSTARVGRSLGVHLILATQKPGGVVDDQIRSNSRFKVCLKVQDSGDSQEMLGRPEAAALVDTGRFYLQVGYNELFEIGQSAWAGAPYYPSQKVIKDRDDAVSIIDTNGQVIAEANTNQFASFTDPPKQLDVVTNYIAAYCEEEHISRWKMWLDPIPKHIYVDTLYEKYKELYTPSKFILNPVVGEYDDPAHQKQSILRVPVTADGNVIVYGSAGSGKSMFIEAMCYSLMREHTPEEVNIYIMDFGTEMLTAFSASPFVGEVILSHETEKVNNLFKLLLGKIEHRKKLLSQFGGSFLQYNLQAKSTEPNLIVFINNYAAFNELFEEHIGTIGYLTREGTKYGVYFVLACTGANNVKFSMLQNFKLIYCLQMNNTDDYSSILGKTEGLTPEQYMGRGMYRRDKDSLLEFQTAAITNEDPPYAAIRAVCSALREKFPNYSAQRVPVLPTEVTREILLPYIVPGDLSRVPVGVEKATLDISYFDFTKNVVNFTFAVNREWNALSYELSLMMSGQMKIKTMVLAPSGNLSSGSGYENLSVFSTPDECARAAADIFSLVLSRNNEYKDCLADNIPLPDFEPVFIIIRSISEVIAVLNRAAPSGKKSDAVDDTPANRLQVAMAKCEKEYNVHFLIFESINSIGSLTAEEWYKKQFTNTCGMWCGSGIDSQYKLSVTKKPSGYSAELRPEFGFVVKNGAAELVKFLQ